MSTFFCAFTASAMACTVAFATTGAQSKPVVVLAASSSRRAGATFTGSNHDWVSWASADSVSPAVSRWGRRRGRCR